MQNQTSFKDILLRTLYGSHSFDAPVIEARVSSLYPLQIVDRFNYMIDISGASQLILPHFGSSNNTNYKIILEQWQFLIKPLPGINEFFFDVAISKFR
jgi:hypothetical protein